VFPREWTPAAMIRFVQTLRAERYDITLDLQRILKSGLCGRLSGASRRIGFHPANTKEFNDRFNVEYLGRRMPHTSKLRHYLAFAEHLHVPMPESLEFGLDRLADGRALPEAVRAIGGRFVGIVIGSSWRSKDWTVDGYQGLVSLIERETAYRVVLLGDRSRRDLAERVVPAAANPSIVNLVGQTSVTELGAILAAAQAAVGPDSGPAHLSAALGTPYVTLFGPTDVERVAPYRCEHLAVRSPVDCEPCGRRRCRRRAGRCMDAITPEMVWHVLKPLLP
jgi:ADP-heptose:LPS heptosyltransferase